MKKAILMPVALLLTAFFAQNVCAEMYKWTDKDGKTQYTQTPPPADIKSKDIEDDIRLSTGKLGNTIPTTPAAKGGDKDEMEKAREEGEKSEKKHRDFCTQQADALKQMAANSLIKWKDAQGERLLTAEEKSTKMEEIEKNIASMCGSEMFSSKDKGSDGSQTEKAVDARFSTDNASVKQGEGNAPKSGATGNGTDADITAAAAQLPATD